MSDSTHNFDSDFQNNLTIELDSLTIFQIPTTEKYEEEDTIGQEFKKNKLNENQPKFNTNNEFKEKFLDYNSSTAESNKVKRGNNKKNSPKIVKQKPYKDKKEKRDKKQIFSIFKDGYSKESKIIKQKNSERTKTGNDVKKKGKRGDNMENEIIRNFFQEIIRNWINFKENLDSCLDKISPSEIRKIHISDIKDKTLEDIYNLKITKKNKDEYYNKNIISKTENYQKIKLSFTVKEAFLVFHNEEPKIREKILENKYPEYFQINEGERKKIISDFYMGLNDFKEYSRNKKASDAWKNKFEKIFERLMRLSINNKE